MEVSVEIIITAIIAGFVLGAVFGYFTSPGIKNSIIKPQKEETPAVWLKRHKTLMLH
tara:strand:+ start:545 stop:715 length:171 start_codon:yes stop_codon:yes gene_type:complete